MIPTTNLVLSWFLRICFHNSCVVKMLRRSQIELRAASLVWVEARKGNRKTSSFSAFKEINAFFHRINWLSETFYQEKRQLLGSERCGDNDGEMKRWSRLKGKGGMVIIGRGPRLLLNVSSKVGRLWKQLFHGMDSIMDKELVTFQLGRTLLHIQH